MVQLSMRKVLDDIIDTLRTLDSSEQERAAHVLLAWLNGSHELERADG